MKTRKSSWFVFALPFAMAGDKSSYCSTISPDRPLHVPSVPKGYALRTVQVITRHGARTALHPLKSFSVPWNCDDETELSVLSLDGDRKPEEPVERLYRFDYIPEKQVLPGNCLLGQLTSLGAKQHRSIGAGFRKAFVTDTKFLSETNWTEQIYVRSTEVPRVQQSAQSQLLSMFPPQQHAGVVKVVPFHVVDSSTDDMTPNWLHCPHLVSYKAELWSKPSPKREKALRAIEGLSDVIQVLERVFDDKYMYDNVSNFRDRWLMDYADTFHVMDCHGLALPAEITPELRQRLYAAVDTFWDLIWGYGKISLGGVGGFLSNDFNRNFKLVVEEAKGSSSSTSQLPLFYLFSGHDTTVAPVLGALQAYDGIWPPLASNIIFQLLEKDSFFFVRLIYNEKVVSPKGCKHEMPNGDLCCTWEEWSDIIRHIGDKFKEYSAECQYKASPAPSTCTRQVPVDPGVQDSAGVYGVAVVLGILCVISWLLLLYQCRQQRARERKGFLALSMADMTERPSDTPDSPFGHGL